MHKYHADNSNYLNYTHGKEYFASHMLSLHFMKLCISNYVFVAVVQNTKWTDGYLIQVTFTIHTISMIAHIHYQATLLTPRCFKGPHLPINMFSSKQPNDHMSTAVVYRTS